MTPVSFYKCLADETRLQSVLLIAVCGELCVCDLMVGLSMEQPKVSRHLAQLRSCGVLLDERRGKWVYYRLHPDLPSWAREVVLLTAAQNGDYFSAALKRVKSSQAQTRNCG
ncbi:metalloregulator ArsR/SmtB family transcription factor [Ostreibacterium oceani]|uniref:Metalloregulator ArsR/SmtB family transcription factor n=1 Tax=Ostreibacterium oceani TaxID=2654998 RepID=A0A6N7EXN6_9GAMM|nr:metalloregulator ArsR/SmtB family transcription factor [Ostreibacterium oceani]MPV86149.1 metalloregulator ArsR/SmtB family transcription factor [Ostreibacterium oceani]